MVAVRGEVEKLSMLLESPTVTEILQNIDRQVAQLRREVAKGGGMELKLCASCGNDVREEIVKHDKANDKAKGYSYNNEDEDDISHEGEDNSCDSASTTSRDVEGGGGLLDVTQSDW